MQFLKFLISMNSTFEGNQVTYFIFYFFFYFFFYSEKLTMVTSLYIRNRCPNLKSCCIEPEVCYHKERAQRILPAVIQHLQSFLFCRPVLGIFCFIRVNNLQRGWIHRQLLIYDLPNDWKNTLF